MYFSVIQPWPEDALEMVANKFLEDVQLNDNERKNIVSICKSFHTSALQYSTRYAKSPFM